METPMTPLDQNSAPSSAPASSVRQALESIDSALQVPGVAEDLAAHGAQITAQEVEAALQDSPAAQAASDSVGNRKIALDLPGTESMAAALQDAPAPQAASDAPDPAQAASDAPDPAQAASDAPAPAQPVAVDLPAAPQPASESPVVPAPADQAPALSDLVPVMGTVAQAPMPDPQFVPNGPEAEPQAADLSVDEQAQLGVGVFGQKAEQPASLEERVAELEKTMATVREIMLHHGLRGPQS